MAARTIEAAPHQWELVADAVHNRRTELGLSAKQLVERAGPGLSVAVLSLIENHRRNSYTVRTMRALCRGLDWSEDSVERILDGEKPEAERLLDPSQEQRLLTTEERLDRLEAQLADLKSEWELAKLTENRRRLSAEASRVTEQEQARQAAEAREHQAEAG